MTKKLTEEQKAERAAQRKINIERQKNEQAANKVREKIHAEMNQRRVQSITISIEWKKSRTYGYNPHATAEVRYKDDGQPHTFERREGFTCSGCGYDKESTVIAQIFNTFMKYKLYEKYDPARPVDEKPYGINYWKSEEKNGLTFIRAYYGDGIGTSCYTNGIAKFIDGTFVHIASGKSFDVYQYTDEPEKKEE